MYKVILISNFKTENAYEDFSSKNEMFDFSNYSTKWKHYDKSNKLVIGKIKHETGVAANEEFVWLKSKINLFVIDNNEHEKARSLNNNIIPRIGHNEYNIVI